MWFQMKHPTQKPHAASSQVAVQHEKRATRKSHVTSSKLAVKHTDARPRPMNHEKRLGLAGFQSTCNRNVCAMRLPATPYGEKGVSPNIALVKNSKDTSGKMIGTRFTSPKALKKCCRMMVQLVRCSRPARMRTDCSSMNWSSLPAETLWPMSKSELLPNKRYPKDTFGLGLVVSAGAGASAVVITPLGASRNFSNAASPTSFKASILKRTFN
mmetsp:Transcript_107791/g.310434  ORF Transcript_107791/g.310434 Transcript_107791/m.310434 type:complete len:213 (+) Transcript_107791:207-845(+)